MAHRPLIPLLLTFIGGLLLSQSGFFQSAHRSYLSLPFLLSGLFLVVLLSPSRFSRWSLLPLFFLLGAFLIPRNGGESTIQDLAIRGERVLLEGTVLKPLSSSGDIARYAIRIHWLKEKKERHPEERRIDAKCRLTIYRNPRLFHPGDRVRFPAKLGTFRNFNNPGRYDYELSMRSKGYACTASVSDGRMVVPMGKGSLGFPRAWIEGARRGVRDFLRSNLSEDNGGILSALLLGERQGIGASFRERLNRTGLGHILAVSGLHIGLLAWLAFSLFKALLSFSYRVTLATDTRKISALASMLAVTGYTALTGFQVSSQRAMIMALVYFSSIIIGRDRDLWSTLAIAAFLVLSLDPAAVSSISFQLSFMAVVGILFLAPKLMRGLPSPPLSTETKTGPILKGLYSYLVGTAVVTLSAVFFLLPVSAYYFHQVSLVAVPANMTVLPILGLWVLPLGLLSVFSLPLSHVISRSLLEASTWGLDLMKIIVELWADIPWAAIWTVIPSIFEMMLFYGLLLLILSWRGRRWARPAIVMILSLFLADISYWVLKTQFNRTLQVTFLDVGQGNAALVRFPGRQRMLIDGGGFSRDTFDVGKLVVAPYLLDSKIRRVDYLVLSHPHPDHMNGLRFIARQFRPKEFWYNGRKGGGESFQELMHIVDSGDTVIFLPKELTEPRNVSGVKVELLHPPPRGGDKWKPNDSSMVVRMSYKGISFLFPGDIEEAGEEIVVQRAGTRLRSDILLVPHHGGRTSSSTKFLDAVKPRICVISCGRGNPYGFPHPETLERLERTGCRILRIDQVGSINISVDKEGFRVETFLE
ncbi:MAG: DNA internalization-related competence protein ComEC/Rec2 [Deltaproteobacteria bacterium]|nr:DNA internalization-related competence protein ComEC/Rec2 [Deltaproteobacteria bacterium]MBW2137955.1 DNA internalization-related competence protein ComEC/Rec2 [Deltaproteobacteria bacterium]